MANKRSKSQEKEQGAQSPPGKKPRLVVFEPVRLPPISTVSELNRHALVFQNRKLSETLEHSKRTEVGLRDRIEKLEQRQIRDDVFLCIVNRHWNRLDEEVRILLQRFDSETEVEYEVEKSESENTVSFLALLSQWDKEELDRELSQRVEFSRRVVAKLVRAFDRVSQRNDKLTRVLQKLQEQSAMSRNSSNDVEVQDAKATVDAELLAENLSLRQENERLQSLATSLQEKNYTLSSGHSRMMDKLSAAETKLDEYKKEAEENEFELNKAHSYAEKLAFRMKDAIANLSKANSQQQLEQASSTLLTGETLENSNGGRSANASPPPPDRNQLAELSSNLEEQRELAASRLNELSDLNKKFVETVQLAENLRTELAHLPDSRIQNSHQYLRLQSQFSILFTESTQVSRQCKELLSQVGTMKTSHLRQIEQMENEELLAQKQLRTEMVQLEEQLSQVRREYEMLRYEFEQNLAANEQSGPLNKELRQLITSYKSQNGQFRSEVQRFKRKWKDAVCTIAKVQKELDTEKKLHENCIHVSLSHEDVDSHLRQGTSEQVDSILAEMERSGEVSLKHGHASEDPNFISEEVKRMSMDDLRSSIMRKMKRLAHLELALQASKLATSEENTRVDTFKRLKFENSKLRSYICGLSNKRGKENMPGIEDPVKVIRKLEEQLEKLKKEIAACKQEEESLLAEMEATGQAFEEMQDQNVRLIQQLKEKDDANFKLMSDRIKTNQQQKLLNEEKTLLQDQIVALQNQMEAQNLVVRKLEDKESLLQQQLSTSEKDIASRQQAVDLHRRKAIEGAQSQADLMLQVEKLTAQLTEAQAAVDEKTENIQAEVFKISRLQEELSIQKKRLERSKKLEKGGGAADEILLEEIRELKQHLTCPSCKVRRKDGVLTKCYHVFCMECLKTRYDTRQRKCPKCNAAFGANDFKRIYIG